MSALRNIVKMSLFYYFYLVNDRIPCSAKCPSVILIDIERVFLNFNCFSYPSSYVIVNVGNDFGVFHERVFLNFNCFSYPSSCVIVNVGNDFGVFHENVVFGSYGVLLMWNSLSVHE